jgi:exodeoxyribonuclease III
MTSRIFSYNVNGLRAAINKGFVDWLKSENPDIICLQETKIQQGQVEPALFEDMGYSCYWHYAEKKGYSGVAIFTKVRPVHIEYGIGNEKYDSEGRFLRLDFGDMTLINSYFPSGTMGDMRQAFKMDYLADFLSYVKALKKIRPALIISGDYNICHKPIDINFPQKHTGVSGFLPEERAWFDDYIKVGFIDTFRVFNQQPEQYSWWSYRAGARPKNLGWRIDYHIISEPMRPRLKEASIHSQVFHSDHCPVSVTIG